MDKMLVFAPVGASPLHQTGEVPIRDGIIPGNGLFLWMGIPGNVFSKSGLPLSHFAATLPTLTYLITVGPRLFFKADFPTCMFLLETPR